MKPPPLLFDTSVYIPYLRGEAYGSLMRQAGRSGRLRLSSVVLAELYAGTRSASDKADLDAVLQAYRALRFLVTPEDYDWVRAGQGIRRYARVYGPLEPRQHMNDVLILLSAARVGAEVVTEDARRFTRWRRLLRRPELPIRVRGVERRRHFD